MTQREEYIKLGLIKPAVEQNAAFFAARGYYFAAAAMAERTSFSRKG